MFTLLYLTGLGVYGFIGAMFLLSIALVTAIEYEKGFSSFIVFGGMIALFLFGTEPSGLASLKENWSTFAIAAAVYIPIGVAWGIVKWWFFVRRIRDTYHEMKDAFLTEKGITDKKIPDEMLAEFKEHCGEYVGRGGYRNRYSSNGSYGRYKLEFSKDGRVVAPIVNNHKARITSWMVYWPWSAMWTFIDDPIRRFYNRIYTALREFYQHISNSAFAGVNDDFRAPPPPPAAPTGGNADEEAGGLATRTAGTPTGPLAQGATSAPTARQRRGFGNND